MEEELEGARREERKKGDTIAELNNLIQCLRGEVEIMKKKYGLLLLVLWGCFVGLSVGWYGGF